MHPCRYRILTFARGFSAVFCIAALVANYIFQHLGIVRAYARDQIQYRLYAAPGPTLGYAISNTFPTTFTGAMASPGTAAQSASRFTTFMDAWFVNIRTTPFVEYGFVRGRRMPWLARRLLRTLDPRQLSILYPKICIAGQKPL